MLGSQYDVFDGWTVSRLLSGRAAAVRPVGFPQGPVAASTCRLLSLSRGSVRAGARPRLWAPRLHPASWGLAGGGGLRPGRLSFRSGGQTESFRRKARIRAAGGPQRTVRSEGSDSSERGGFLFNQPGFL